MARSSSLRQSLRMTTLIILAIVAYLTIRDSIMTSLTQKRSPSLHDDAEKTRLLRLLKEKDDTINALSASSTSSFSWLTSQISSGSSSDEVSSLASVSPPLVYPPQPLHYGLTQQTGKRALWKVATDCSFGDALHCWTRGREYEHFNDWPKKSSCSDAFDIKNASIERKALLGAVGQQLSARLSSVPASSMMNGQRPLSLNLKASAGRDLHTSIGCSKRTGLDDFDEQMRRTIEQWRKRSKVDDLPLAFTMTDQKYQDLLIEQQHVAKFIVGVSSFLVAAYDQSSRDVSCSLGLDTATPLSSSSLPSSVSSLRVATTHSKFIVAKVLAEAGVNFLFWEMDVFIFLRPPAWIFDSLSASSASSNDIIVSSHQCEYYFQ